MSLSLEQLWAYLQRIRFPLQDRLPRPDATTLRTVHELHSRYVVFENMSIQVKEWRETDMTAEGLKLDIPTLYQKIVRRGRGGYCFEINTLFAALLTGLGYTVRPGAARVVMNGLEVNPEVSRDHVYLISPITHKLLFVSGGMLPEGHLYLCDAGLGGNTLTEPVLVPSREEGLINTSTFHPPTQLELPQYRIRWGKCGTPACPQAHDNIFDQGYYLQIWANRGSVPGAWHDLYFFTLTTYGPMDYIVSNYFTSTIPSSLFVKGPFCSRVDEKGSRFILVGNQLKCRDIAGNKETHYLRSSSELSAALRTYFGIVVPATSLGHLRYDAPPNMHL